MNLFDNLELLGNYNEKTGWENTPLNTFVSINPRKKGSIYEKLVDKILITKGYDVSKALNCGHDRVINNIKTEIKVGLATRGNADYQTIYNHIGLNKDWQQILFGIINGDGHFRLILFTKEKLPLELLTKQQGGKNESNDDYLCNNKNSRLLLFHPNAIIIEE